MQELIQQLTEKAGLSNEQATKSLSVIKDFVKEKYPMLGGAVDQMMGADAPTTTATENTTTTTQGNAVAATAPAKEEGNSMLDKISDVIPGAVGEKIEDFAKGIGDKIGGIFGK
jgi:hypothetical protein